MIPVVIPAKNEKDNLEDTVTSLRETAEFANQELFIVVVDDGSTDNTSEIAQSLNCHLVRLKDRGYSALGLPELADTHNAGFEYIDKHLKKEEYDYLMVVGADTTFEPNYIALLLDAMETDSQLVMCAGILNKIKTNYDAVRGSGRIIRNSFWTLVGRRSPNTFHSWESYPIVFANAHGFKTRTIYDATMHTPREPMAIIDWKRYGIQMKENGSIFPYVLLRASKRIYLHKDPYGFYRLIYGYLFSKPNQYNKKLRNFNKRRQMKKIFGFASN
jgi:glycosyltransferase involved in cell wall biosynthesis